MGALVALTVPGLPRPQNLAPERRVPLQGAPESGGWGLAPGLPSASAWGSSGSSRRRMRTLPAAGRRLRQRHVLPPGFVTSWQVRSGPQTGLRLGHGKASRTHPARSEQGQPLLCPAWPLVSPEVWVPARLRTWAQASSPSKLAEPASVPEGNGTASPGHAPGAALWGQGPTPPAPLPAPSPSPDWPPLFTPALLTALPRPAPPWQEQTSQAAVRGAQRSPGWAAGQASRKRRNPGVGPGRQPLLRKLGLPSELFLFLF